MPQIKHLLIFIALPVLLLLTNSCSTIYTTNIQDLTSYEEGSNIYALPRTCLKVEFTAVRTIYLAGPYAYKAEELLKLKNVKQEDEISWKISNISMTPCVEPDPEQYFSVKEQKGAKTHSELLKMSQTGLIINSDVYAYNNSKTSIKVDNEINSYSFDQPTINFEEIRNRYYNKLSYPAEFIDNTNSLKDAGIIADEILTNRGNIEKLFINDDELYPMGDAAVAGVKAFKNQENSLLTLFTGITVTDTIKRWFYICPNAKEPIQRHTLCKFSEANGFIDKSNDIGKALVLVIKDLDVTKHLDNLLLPDNSPTKKNILFYRVPDKAEITLLNGSIPLAEIQIPVYQLGSTVPYFIKR